MNKNQALKHLFELALRAELPKGLTANEATQYINSIHESKKLLDSIIKEVKEDN
jgi:hypothetical protein